MNSTSNDTAMDDDLNSRTLVIDNRVDPNFNPWKHFLISKYHATTDSLMKVTGTTRAFQVDLNSTDVFLTSTSSSNSSVLSAGPYQATVSSNISTASSSPAPEYDGSAYPVFCNSLSTAYMCHNTPLSLCRACDMGGASLMAALVLLLGLAVVVANSLILMVTLQRKKNNKLESMDLHRCSLAIADLLTGIQILLIFPVNFGTSFNGTSKENHSRYFLYRESAAAAIGGVFFLLTFTSSIYNLVYLAGQRLYAFVRPIHYRMQRKRNISLGLGVVWILAIVSATVLVWFPQDFSSAYVPSTFLFFFETKATSDKTAPLSLLFLFYLLPYLLTIIFLTASGIIVFFHLRKSSKPVSPYSTRKDSDVSTSTERQYFITVAFMELGFTITIVPAFVVVLIDNLYPAIPYTDIAPIYAACFYVAMINSLVNVVVYSVRDPKFRSNVADILVSYCPCCCGGDSIAALRVFSQRKQRLRSASSSFAPASPMTMSESSNKTAQRPSVSKA